MEFSPNSYAKCAVHLKNAFRIKANFYVTLGYKAQTHQVFRGEQGRAAIAHD
jgi:hypothetical protein